MSLGNEKEKLVQETLDTNKRQIEFYQTDPSKRKTNFATELWKSARRPFYYLVGNAGIWNDINGKQLDWMGNLGGKRVLDLGCYSGNALSLTVAESSKEYLGIDLSAPAVGELQEAIDKRGIENAKAIQADFLSPDFVETDFNVCYAQGVLHHFKHFEAMLEVLADKLLSNGIVVTCDPLQTALSGRIVRTLYRPFQLNKDWEWPFTRNSFEVIEKFFIIEEVQGFMGYSKRAFPMAFVNKEWAVSYAKKMHQKDLEKANRVSNDLWGCMQVIMKLRKK